MKVTPYMCPCVKMRDLMNLSSQSLVWTYIVWNLLVSPAFKGLEVDVLITHSGREHILCSTVHLQYVQ